MTRRRSAAKEPGALTEFPSVHEGRLPEMAQPIAIDSYSNPEARLGVGAPNLTETGSYPLIRLTQDYPLLLSLFRGSWIVRRVIETIPDDMLKSFPELETEVKPELLKQFNRTVRKTGTLNKLRTGAKWGRLFGGAAAIIVIAGHDNLMQPLELDDVELGAYKGLIPLDRWSGIIPGPSLNDDIEDTVAFGLPSSYDCIMERGNTSIHHSRIIRFTGRELPQWEKQVELYWGQSEVEVMFDELKKRDYSSWNIVSLLTRAQILSIEEPQLAALMSGAAGSNQAYTNFITRMESMTRLLNNQGLMVLGKDGKLNQNTYSFGGIADVYHEFMKDLSAACQIPYEVLFGRESGLGSNGESGLQLYYDMVERKRSSELDVVMDKLIPVIAMSTFGEVPDDIDHHWAPVRSMSEKERAELAKSTADAIAAYFNADLMTKREARKEIQQTAPTTGLGTNLTDEAVAATPDKYASELGGGMGGEMGGLEMPGAPGEGEGAPGEGEGTPEPQGEGEGSKPPSLTAGAGRGALPPGPKQKMLRGGAEKPKETDEAEGSEPASGTAPRGEYPESRYGSYGEQPGNGSNARVHIGGARTHEMPVRG